MNEPENIGEAKRWLRFAAEDLRGAEGLMLQPDAMPRHACWLAQQAAEKAIKAVLVFQEIEFPKTHDLDALRNRVPEGWRLNLKAPDLAGLTEWSVEARYPGDWPEATAADAREALDQARGILESVRGDLAARGVDLA
jgi:HEPN domain-containing protein